MTCIEAAVWDRAWLLWFHDRDQKCGAQPSRKHFARAKLQLLFGIGINEHH